MIWYLLVPYILLTLGAGVNYFERAHNEFGNPFFAIFMGIVGAIIYPFLWGYLFFDKVDKWLTDR